MLTTYKEELIAEYKNIEAIIGGHIIRVIKRGVTDYYIRVILEELKRLENFISDIGIKE